MSDTATVLEEKLSDEEKEVVRPPLVLNKRTMGWISSYLSSIVEERTPTWWWVAMGVTVPMTLMCLACLAYQNEKRGASLKYVSGRFKTGSIRHKRRYHFATNDSWCS